MLRERTVMESELSYLTEEGKDVPQFRGGAFSVLSWTAWVMQVSEL